MWRSREWWLARLRRVDEASTSRIVEGDEGDEEGKEDEDRKRGNKDAVRGQIYQQERRREGGDDGAGSRGLVGWKITDVHRWPLPMWRPCADAEALRQARRGS